MGKEYNLDKELAEGHRTARGQSSNTFTTMNDGVTHDDMPQQYQRQEYNNMIWDTEARY